MKKRTVFNLIFVFAILFCNNSCKCQSKNVKNNFVRIEIEKGPFHAIRLFEEGLLCKSVDSNYTPILEFFPKHVLDIRKISRLEKYLLSEPQLLKDTTIDNSMLVLNGENPLLILIIVNNHMYSSIWIDGDCEYLEKCIQLLNDIIPESKKNVFTMKFYHG
ncbi:MAG: hypothetical protein GX259_09990 [Bacteroidales bacterium]|nr:hypothetical protein [Bacteroidales bacterium]